MMCDLTVREIFCCCCLSLEAVCSAQSLMKRVGYQGGKLASIVSSCFFSSVFFLSVFFLSVFSF